MVVKRSSWAECVAKVSKAAGLAVCHPTSAFENQSTRPSTWIPLIGSKPLTSSLLDRCHRRSLLEIPPVGSSATPPRVSHVRASPSTDGLSHARSARRTNNTHERLSAARPDCRLNERLVVRIATTSASLLVRSRTTSSLQGFQLSSGALLCTNTCKAPSFVSSATSAPRILQSANTLVFESTAVPGKRINCGVELLKIEDHQPSS